MKRAVLIVTSVVFAVAGSAACSTKGFVREQVGQVSKKVDSLSQSLEETQERTKRNEAKIAEVDQKTQAAQKSADEARTAAGAADTRAQNADTRAGVANDAATAAAAKAEAVDKASKRMTFEVVLSDDEGNFKFGQSTLPDATKAKIDDLIKQLKDDPKGAYFEIEGHTDNVGPEDVNQKLGLDRAEAVKRYLYQQHQIPLHRMNVISYGQDKPVAPNTTKEGRAQNRRVVIRVLV
jgi:peptidoglycan-associated lipoprotein